MERVMAGVVDVSLVLGCLAQLCHMSRSIVLYVRWMLAWCWVGGGVGGGERRKEGGW